MISRKHKGWINTLLALLVVSVSLHAQEPDSCRPQELWGAGLYGGLNLNKHTVSFNALPGVPNCCPHFSEGEGKGVAFGALFSLPLGSSLHLELSGEYSAYDGTLRATQEQPADNNGLTTAVYEYTIASTLRSINLSPSLRYSWERFSLHAGFRMGYFASNSFVQQEKLVAPDELVYENGRRDRMNYAGDIPSASSLRSSLTMGLSAAFPMNTSKSLSIVPQLSAEVGLSNVNKEVPWKVQSYRLGVGLMYMHSIIPPKPVVLPVEPPPPPPKAIVTPPPPVAKLELVEPLKMELVNDDGLRIELPLKVKNTVSSNMYAMIHYIFFDSASAEIPQRYVLLDSEQAQSFNPMKLNITTSMQVYYHILNLVGTRMKDNPSIAITLTGCNTNNDGEKNNLRLSRDRAEAVKKYLTDVWGIAPERITVKARNLPAVASNTNTQDGTVENRRVEITTSSPELLEPIVYSDTTRTINASKVKYSGKVLAESGIKEWKFIATQNGEDIKTLSGSGALPATLAWNIKDDAMLLQATEKPVTIRLEVTDGEGKTIRSPADTLTLTQTTVNHSMVQKYSLITFGFNTSNVSATDQHILNIIKSNIKPTSKVSITGYTDRVGSAVYNQRLSLQRGLEIAKMLGVDEKNVTGAGGGELLYDNNLPEGRFYCRTVMIVIETPLD